ncbi:MAG: glycine zipper 2TM domain-containing protein [Proteobacteria bacterium]|nr:glycine zipper 2TM domain-containing protein [Pseudomonadota bacterium]
MDTMQTTNRIHPLMAGAAASVMLVSLLGAAAITGILPKSRGSNTPDMPVSASAPLAAVSAAPAAPVTAPLQTAAVQTPAKPKVVVHRKVVYRTVDRPAPQYAQAAPNYAQPAPNYGQPTQQAAVQAPAQAPQHSVVGIAAGAVLGGLLGNQVGGGNGKTLATVAGALGGGYLGNEVGKKYGY